MSVETGFSPELLPAEPKDSLDSLERGVERASMKQVQDVGREAVESYFHGTVAQLKVGDEIYPGDYGIIDNKGKNHASATTVEDVAWRYAESKERIGGPRPRVYQVVPADGESVKRLGPQRGEVNSPAFKIVDVVDIQPGMQGTFPEINWSKYSPYITENHPRNPLWTPDFEASSYQPDSPDQPALPGLEDRQQFIPESEKSIM